MPQRLELGFWEYKMSEKIVLGRIIDLRKLHNNLKLMSLG
jgi:hypothetical protein